MTDAYTEMDDIELGQHAGANPDDSDAAAELMVRALRKNPLIVGACRRDGNQVNFTQKSNGPALRNFGDDYDFDLRHIISIEEADEEKLPDGEQVDAEIAAMVRVRCVRTDYKGYARPDYAAGTRGASYKGDGEEPRPTA